MSEICNQPLDLKMHLVKLVSNCLCSGEMLFLSCLNAIWQCLPFISRCQYIFLLVVCFLHVLESSVTFCSRKSPLLVFLSMISVRSLSHKVSPTCCVVCIYYLLISCRCLIAVHSGTILPYFISVVK